MVGEDWQSFEDALASTLAGLPPGAYLILEVRASINRYLQLTAGPRGLKAEVVADSFLDDAEKWGSHGARSLEKLGWRPPDASEDEILHPELYRGSPASDVNHHREWPDPPPHAEIAAVVCETFRTVFGTKEPSELSYSSMAAEGPPLTHPLLDACLSK